MEGFEWMMEIDFGGLHGVEVKKTLGGRRG